MTSKILRYRKNVDYRKSVAAVNAARYSHVKNFCTTQSKLLIFLIFTVCKFAHVTGFLDSRKFDWFQIATILHLWNSKMNFSLVLLKMHCKDSRSPLPMQ